ncbi:uncharacterized protein LOC106392703 [Brassica napus]|uniref:uncharacterized protein LOC106392703 n=1 Tax=Brassica napus TaxID=3708 RepID=UPI0006AA958B|nr:uncharacterized protein LOC106392703 [Brassica napus]
MDISLHPKERRRIRTQKLALVESGICTEADLDIILQAGIDLVQLAHKKSKNSWQANQLLLLREHVYDWIKRSIGNGETTYLWSCNWSPYGRLSTYLRDEPSSRTGIPSTATLAELWEIDHWVLPPARSDNQVRIYTFLLQLTITGEADVYVWCPGGSQKTRYSTRQVYNLLQEQLPQVSWYKEVWFSKGIPKHRFLTWLMVLNRSPTRDRLMNWGLITDGACLFCNSSLETRSHLFFDCSFSWDIWSSLIHRMQHQSPCSWLEILDFLHNFAGTKAERYLLLLTWQATIYALWTERNHRLHRNNYRSASSLTSDIDRTIKRRIASIRPDDPQLSSVMLTLWFASSLPPPVIST